MAERRHRWCIHVVLCVTMVLAARPALGQSRPAPPPLDTSTTAAPPATDRSPSAPEPAPPRSTKLAALAFGGAALLSAGVGVGFGAAALAAESDFDREPTTRTADRAEGHMLVADIALGVAIVAAVTSVVLLLRGDRPATREVGLVRF